MADNEVQELMKRAKKQGWSVRKTGSGHWSFKAPSGKTVVVAATPSDPRGMENARAELRRAGLKEDAPERSRWHRPPEILRVVSRLVHLIAVYIEADERFTLRELVEDKQLKEEAFSAGLAPDKLHLQAISVTQRDGYRASLWKAVEKSSQRPLRAPKGEGIYIYPSLTAEPPHVPHGYEAVPWRWDKARIAKHFTTPNSVVTPPQEEVKAPEDGWDMQPPPGYGPNGVNGPWPPTIFPAELRGKNVSGSVGDGRPSSGESRTVEALLKANRRLLDSMRVLLSALDATTAVCSSMVEDLGDEED